VTRVAQDLLEARVVAARAPRLRTYGLDGPARLLVDRGFRIAKPSRGLAAVCLKEGSAGRLPVRLGK
jgi:hypothetical protein